MEMNLAAVGNRISQYMHGDSGQAAGPNVGDLERWGSLIGGGGLALYGLTRGTLGGMALALVGGSLLYRGATGQCQLYKALGISTAEPHAPQTSIPAGHGVKLEESITVMRPSSELYQFWRKLENLPKIMSNVESVTAKGGNKYHWVVKGPLGMKLEWDAEIHHEKENEVIGWRSLPGAEVDTAGSVHFTNTQRGQGTEIKVILKYDPPAGKIGATVSGMFASNPQQMIREDLQRFKQAMEGNKQTAKT